jgi:hypothetical protein
VVYTYLLCGSFSAGEKSFPKTSTLYGEVPLVVSDDGLTLRRISDSEGFKKSSRSRTAKPAPVKSNLSSSQPVDRMSPSIYNPQARPPSSRESEHSSQHAAYRNSRAPSHQPQERSDGMARDPHMGVYRMPAVWEDPKNAYMFQQIDEDQERYRVQKRSETWEREVRWENVMRKQNGYCLASYVPPPEWDGRCHSALQYLSDTRTMAPSSSNHAPLPKFNFRTTDHPRPPSPPLPTYNGPPPNNWFANNSLVPMERARSQGARSTTTGNRDSRYAESGWEDINMHHDGGAGPSNIHRSSRFASDGDGPYARLQRRLL